MRGDPLIFWGSTMKHNVKILHFERDSLIPVRESRHRVTTIPGLCRLLRSPRECYRMAEMAGSTALSLGLVIQGSRAYSVHPDYILGAEILESI